METARNINQAFDQRTYSSTWFRIFYKGDENLEDEECRTYAIDVNKITKKKKIN